MARRATASRAFALLAAMTLAGCIAAPGATDPAAAHQRAQTVLSAWAEAVAAAGEHAAVTPVRELTSQIGDWEEAVGDNNKRALMAGMIASDRPLSEDAPPDGEVEWQDGTTTKVPLISAQQAIVAMESNRGALLRLHDAPGHGGTADVGADPDDPGTGDGADLGVHRGGHGGQGHPRRHR